MTRNHAALLANARRARRNSTTAIGLKNDAATLATLDSRPVAVRRTIDAACAAAFKVIADAGMPLYLADGAQDVAAAIYRRVLRGAETSLASTRAKDERDAAELAEILS